MTFRTLCRRALAATAGLGLAGFCLIAVAAPAGASTNIDQKATGTHCSIKGSPYLYCLTYAVNETGGLWASEGASTSNLCVSYPSNCAVFGPLAPDTGVGAIVRNDAHSMENGFGSGSICDVTTFVSPNFEGASDVLEADFMGNLSSGLLNNEASIYYRCP